MSYQPLHVQPTRRSRYLRTRNVLILTLCSLLLAGLMTAGAFWVFRPANRVVSYLNRGEYAQAVDCFNTKLSRYAKSSSGRVTAAFLQSVQDLAEGELSYEEASGCLKTLSEADSSKITQAANSTRIELASLEITRQLALPDYSAAVAVYNDCRGENLSDAGQDSLMQTGLQTIVSDYTDGSLSYETAEAYLDTMSGVKHYNLASEAKEYQRSLSLEQVALLLQQKEYGQAAEIYRGLTLSESERTELAALWTACAEELAAGWQEGSLTEAVARTGLTLMAGLPDEAVSTAAGELLAHWEHESKGAEVYAEAEALYASGSYAETMKKCNEVFQDSSSYEAARDLYQRSKDALLAAYAQPQSSAECEAFLTQLEADFDLTGDADLQNRLTELETEQNELKAAEEKAEAAKRLEEEEAKRRENSKKSIWSDWSGWSGWGWFKNWF